MKYLVIHDEHNLRAVQLYNDFIASHDIASNIDAADELRVIGGDGTLIRTISKFNSIKIPVGLIGAGTINYLEMGDNPIVTNIRRLECHRNNKSIGKAFNEISLKSTNALMAKFDVYIDAELIYEGMRGDGLIVATSVGSTAYAMSAGGPIAQIGTPVHIIVPNNEYSRYSRPLIVSDNKIISIRAATDMSVILDGTVVDTVLQNQLIHIIAADSITLRHANTLVREEKKR